LKQEDLKKEDDIQIRGINDVEINLIAFFSDGQYSLGSMSQFTQFIEGLQDASSSHGGANVP